MIRYEGRRGEKPEKYAHLENGDRLLQVLGAMYKKTQGTELENDGK